MTYPTFSELDARRAEGASLKATDILEAGPALEALIELDPLVHAYRRRPDGPLTTPEDVLAQRDLMALDVLKGRAGIVAEYRDRVPLAFQIRAAVPFLWHSEMIRISQEGRLPPHVIGREQLSHPVMWWTTPDIYMEKDGYGLEGMFLIDHASYFRVALFMMNEKHEQRMTSVTYKYGSRFPQDYDDPEMAGVVLKMLSFVNSPYIPKDQRRVTRQARRAAERAGVGWQEGEEHTVTFIDLRAAEQQATGRRDGEATGVEWHHRWIVRGHHRAQWYPSLKGHKVIWVAPYVKGPEGMPLKVPVYNVNR